MIKRIIFDIDNTLLDTNKDCITSYTEYFKNKDKALKLYDFLGVYEVNNGNYDKIEFEKYIKNNFDANFNLDDLLSIYGNNGTILSSDIIDTLDYLSKKYELVALTNWYVTPQRSRLNKVGILKYFKDVYGFEDGPFKPDERAFIKACGNHKNSECLMVGDSISNDIEVPYKLGLNVRYLGYSNKYPSISRIKELEDIL